MAKPTYTPFHEFGREPQPVMLRRAGTTNRQLTAAARATIHGRADHPLARCWQEEMKHAAEIGVALDLWPLGNGDVYLMLIQRTSAKPGTGAVVMKRLVELADREQARIALCGFAQLRPYYEQFGFELQQNVGDDCGMVRLPR